MSIADELERLVALHQQGVLSDDELARLKARVIAQVETEGFLSGSSVGGVARLRRSREDRWLGGVCGGIARHTGIESWIWRLAFTALFLFWGAGLLIYILLWIFVPDE